MNLLLRYRVTVTMRLLLIVWITKLGSCANNASFFIRKLEFIRLSWKALSARPRHIRYYLRRKRMLTPVTSKHLNPLSAVHLMALAKVIVYYPIIRNNNKRVPKLRIIDRMRFSLLQPFVPYKKINLLLNIEGVCLLKYFLRIIHKKT